MTNIDSNVICSSSGICVQLYDYAKTIIKLPYYLPFKNFNDKVKKHLPSGWKIVTTSKDTGDNKYNYNGILLVNEEEKQIVFSSAGTMFSNLYDVWTVIQFMLNCIPYKFLKAGSFLKNGLNLLKDQGYKIDDYKISATGHSMGAVFALFQSFFMQSSEYSMDSIFLFGSPGAKSIMEKCEKRGVLEDITSNETKHYSYVVNKNLVNRFGKHIKPPIDLSKICTTLNKCENAIDQSKLNNSGFLFSWLGTAKNFIAKCCKYKDSVQNYVLEYCPETITQWDKEILSYGYGLLSGAVHSAYNNCSNVLPAICNTWYTHQLSSFCDFDYDSINTDMSI